jgi:hypothetical protein
MFKIMNPTSSAPSQPDAIQSDPEIIPNHPLAGIAGKFEGELWNATLAEIQRLRRLDRQKWNRSLKTGRSTLR